MFCLICDCELIISLYQEKFSLLCREYRYIEDPCIGVLSRTFYCNFYQDIEYSLLLKTESLDDAILERRL